MFLLHLLKAGPMVKLFPPPTKKYTSPYEMERCGTNYNRKQIEKTDCSSHWYLLLTQRTPFRYSFAPTPSVGLLVHKGRQASSAVASSPSPQSHSFFVLVNLLPFCQRTNEARHILRQPARYSQKLDMIWLLTTHRPNVRLAAIISVILFIHSSHAGRLSYDACDSHVTYWHKWITHDFPVHGFFFHTLSVSFLRRSL